VGQASIVQGLRQEHGKETVQGRSDGGSIFSEAIHGMDNKSDGSTSQI